MEYPTNTIHFHTSVKTKESMISDKTIEIKYLLLLLLCVFVSGDAETRCIEREREALLSFKNGLIDEYGRYLSSWQGDECCEWAGVECSNTTSHVINLYLNDKELRGNIGSSLLKLHYLNLLDLSGNDFGGIPIPEFICSMNQLQELSLQGCHFSGAIPPQLGNLTNLRSLDLSYNNLSGSIPDPRAFPSMSELVLSGNNFTGSIPLNIGQLSELQILDLSHNSFEGLVSESHFIKLHKLSKLDLSYNPLLNLDIAPDWSPPFQLTSISLAGCNVGPYFPKWIRSQRNLTSLDLSDANIRDEAARVLWNLSSSLEHLYLSDNQISGTVPNLSSTSIHHMDLSSNQLSGHIPSFPVHAFNILLSGNMFSGSICKALHVEFAYIMYLDLSNNQLAGEVPNCWEKMPNLRILYLANNSFSGEIPLSLGALLELQILQMHGNNLSGEFPDSLRDCHMLILIDVEGNKLTGEEIPAWIGELHRLQFLNFHGNKLHGRIPPEICNLLYIRVLDLSINNLSWIIPDCYNFRTLSTVENVALGDFHTPRGPNIIVGMSSYGHVLPNIDRNRNGYSSFQWKGKEYEYSGNIKLLKLIDLSSNRLTGNIPKSFSDMKGLYSLNLSRNSLVGHIISDIGKMEMLDSLDLSHNQLSGKIPASMVELHSLGVLDLSNNKLSGKIPTGTQLQSFNASVYANNDGLCGNPLPKCPGDSLRPPTTNPVDNTNEKDDNNFSFIQEVGISMGFGFIFGFWGIIGLFILKKSWRIAFFNLFDDVGDWFYVKIVVFVSKWKQSRNAEMQR